MGAEQLSGSIFSTRGADFGSRLFCYNAVMPEEMPSNPPEFDAAGASSKPPAPASWQKRWRIVGGVTVAICAVMAGLGVEMQILRNSSTLFLVYWGVFALLFFVTLYIVLLDLRYIRAEHAIAQRDLFYQTLGDQEFREALKDAVRSASDYDKSGS